MPSIDVALGDLTLEYDGAPRLFSDVTVPVTYEAYRERDERGSYWVYDWHIDRDPIRLEYYDEQDNLIPIEILANHSLIKLIEKAKVDSIEESCADDWRSRD